MRRRSIEDLVHVVAEKRVQPGRGKKGLGNHLQQHSSEGDFLRLTRRELHDSALLPVEGVEISDVRLVETGNVRYALPRIGSQERDDPMEDVEVFRKGTNI
jgi:hypothetical protein